MCVLQYNSSSHRVVMLKCQSVNVNCLLSSLICVVRLMLMNACEVAQGPHGLQGRQREAYLCITFPPLQACHRLLIVPSFQNESNHQTHQHQLL